MYISTFSHLLVSKLSARITTIQFYFCSRSFSTYIDISLFSRNWNLRSDNFNCSLLLLLPKFVRLKIYFFDQAFPHWEIKCKNIDPAALYLLKKLLKLNIYFSAQPLVIWNYFLRVSILNLFFAAKPFQVEYSFFSL